MIPQKKEERASEEKSIAYQNKDIAAKCLGDQFADKSFAAYGLKVPPVVQVLPTNLPAIEANELRMDHLFKLKDGSIALVDYESRYMDDNKVKYLGYIIRILKKNAVSKEAAEKNRNADDKRRDRYPRIRMLVIYTADVKPENTRPKLDVGCLQFELEEAFLSGLDSEEIESELLAKLEVKQPLTQDEQMKFIVLPLTWAGTAAKQACIRRCFEMAKKIEDEAVQRFVLSGILVFSDKVIMKEDSIRIKEWIRMTKVGQLFEEEKLEYARQQAYSIAERMLQSGDSVEKVTGIVMTLSKEEVTTLWKDINAQRGMVVAMK